MNKTIYMIHSLTSLLQKYTNTQVTYKLTSFPTVKHCSFLPLLLCENVKYLLTLCQATLTYDLHSIKLIHLVAPGV